MRSTCGLIWLLADRASAHTAVRTQMLAIALGIRFLWLPKQAPELNAMDQLWRELKRLIAANRQATSVNALASDAADWVLRLTPQQARRKAGMASKHYWLRNLVNDFWPPTQRASARMPSSGAISRFHSVAQSSAEAVSVPPDYGERSEREEDTEPPILSSQ